MNVFNQPYRKASSSESPGIIEHQDTTAADVNNVQFFCFGKLPTEIRDEIWKLALPGPRCIAMESAVAMSTTFPFSPCILWKLRCVEKAPAIFFVCKEARAQILKTYRPYQGTMGGMGKIYVDSTKDIFCVPRTRNINPDSSLNDLARMVQPKIRYLAVQMRD